MRKKVLSSFIILILVFSFMKIDVLEAIDFNSGEVLNCWSNVDGNFEILYNHSVMRSEVVESYYVDRGNIYLVESSIKDFGAGLPSDTPYDFKYDERNKLYRISNINLEMDNLVYKVGTKRANHRILVNGDMEEFTSFARERSSVEFVGKSIFRWRYYYWRMRR